MKIKIAAISVALAAGWALTISVHAQVALPLYAPGKFPPGEFYTEKDLLLLVDAHPLPISYLVGTFICQG